MPAIAKVDETRKVTVSLGGSCRLRCTHCYITVPQFKFQRRLQPSDVLQALQDLSGQFDAICISGDVDPLLREEEFLDLLEGASIRFPAAHLMFTTRLIPSVAGIDRIRSIGRVLSGRRKLLAPGISYLTATYPNQIEDPNQVPSSVARSEFGAALQNSKIPVLAALRPTMPFHVVPQDEVRKLVQLVAPTCSCVLGEVFILDADSVLAGRFGIHSHQGQLTPMTFLDQPGLWAKYRLEPEIAFAAEQSHLHGRAYFLRSMSAIRYLEQAWDFDQGRLRTKDIPFEGTYDAALP